MKDGGEGKNTKRKDFEDAENMIKLEETPAAHKRGTDHGGDDNEDQFLII